MSDKRSAIIIGCDHAAFDLKGTLIDYLTKQGIITKDVGIFSPEPVDYPEIGIKVASAISTKEYEKGILMCGTGIGMSIVANRFDHVRAALCNDLFSAIMSRRHNDSNVLVIGGRVVGEILAVEILKAWLETSFEGRRHQKRIDMFDVIKRQNLEKTECKTEKRESVGKNILWVSHFLYQNDLLVKDEPQAR